MSMLSFSGTDGNWSPWGAPGPCDKTCGGGTRVRKRTCTNPPPSGDGKDCAGSKTKKEPCNTQACMFLFKGIDTLSCRIIDRS